MSAPSSTSLVVTPSDKRSDASATSSTCHDADLAYIASLITCHSNFPKPGIEFRDIFPVFRNPKASRLLLSRLTYLVQSHYCNSVDVVVGLDSRGFLFAPTIALGLDASFVPIRKSGKLPGLVEKDSYATEYSVAECEVQIDAIAKGARVVVVDDLLATGGTLVSAIKLLKKLGATVQACVVVMELDECQGRRRIVEEAGVPSEHIHSLLHY